MTIDHVIPRHRGGEHTWENLVTACPACNLKKGGRTLNEAHMALLRTPHEPRATVEYLFGNQQRKNEEWLSYLSGW
jgi:5-methylcytosine-specific restriction endonuclease McrA